MNYLIANNKCTLKACDSAGSEVSLDGIATITFTKANFNVGNAAALLSVSILITGAKTTAITDSNGTGSGVINGSSTTVKSNNSAVCLADDSIKPSVTVLADLMNSECSYVQIALSGTSGSSPATDLLTVWISDAGQNKAKAV